MRKAVVQNNEVINVVLAGGDWQPSEGTAVSIPDDSPVAIGYTWDGTAFAAPVVTPTQPDLLQYSAALRYRSETGGITFYGNVVATDDRSKMMIMGARLAAQSDPNFTTAWKTPAGEFVTLDAATIIALSDAVSAHVAACFEKEARVRAGIADDTITTVEQIDAMWVSP